MYSIGTRPSTSKLFSSLSRTQSVLLNETSKMTEQLFMSSAEMCRVEQLCMHQTLSALRISWFKILSFSISMEPLVPSLANTMSTPFPCTFLAASSTCSLVPVGMSAHQLNPRELALTVCIQLMCVKAVRVCVKSNPKCKPLAVQSSSCPCRVTQGV